MGDEGWQISDVVALLGMGRRAVQRSCGQNLASGDLGIVRVDGSKPGKRSYGAEELAQLNLVNVVNQEGMDLASVRDVFDQARSADGLKRLAERRRELDLERAEDATARHLRGRALAVRGDPDALGELVEREAAAGLARAGVAGPFPNGWLLPHLAKAAATGAWEACRPDGLLAVLETPGLDLAIELLLGPGSFARVVGALEE